ncbi:hypothetical protein JW933_05935 [candidate division FCPU426 bacterium]|nr:hypothetical protein [candidate division FCPU426 bacterium]
MPKTKGTDIAALRKILKKAGSEKEQQFLERLAPELADLYQRSIHTTWNDIHMQTALYEAAALMLFPGEPEYMMELGKEMARHSYSTVYKIFLRIPTVEFIMERAAIVWRSYHDQGQAEVTEIHPGSGTFVVHGYPELPRKMREVIGGHIYVLLEMTGARGIIVKTLDTNPRCWEWKMQWNK